MGIIEKYSAVIRELEDNELHTPATIANRLREGPDRFRLRIMLGRVALKLSADGGWLHIEGQAPIQGWYGHNWKDVCLKGFDHDARKEES